MPPVWAAGAGLLNVDGWFRSLSVSPLTLGLCQFALSWVLCKVWITFSRRMAVCAQGDRLPIKTSELHCIHKSRRCGSLSVV